MAKIFYYFYWIPIIQEISMTLPKTIASVDHIGELTKKLREETIPATHALVRHFRWRNISLVVENTTIYTETLDSISKGLNKDTLGYSFTAPPLVSYEYPDSFPTMKKILKEASRKSRIIVLVMNIRLAKEFLIAAYDLNMTDGKNVFIAFESGIISMSSFQKRPFKWVVAAFGDSWKEYITRSYKLCWMWKVTLLIMPRLPDSLITKINDIAIKLRQVERASRPSVESWKKFENAVFRKVGGYNRFINAEGDVEFPQAIYRYGKDNKGAEACALCALNELTGSSTCFHDINNTFPSMYPVGDFELTRLKSEKTGKKALKLSAGCADKLQMHWPGESSIYDNLVTPGCDLRDDNCLPNRKDAIYIETLTASGILLVLLIGLLVIVREYKIHQKSFTQKLLNEGKLVLIHCETKASHTLQHL